VHVVQVLEPAELSPVATGDLRLVESESGASLEVTANESVLERYRAEVAAYNAGLEKFCRRRAISHASVTCDQPFEDVVLKNLRDGMMLK
jgi:hypothetical protein